jgi:hypothetical protein
VVLNTTNPPSLGSDDVNASSIWNNNKLPIGNQTIVYINSITKWGISTDLMDISGQLMTFVKFKESYNVKTTFLSYQSAISVNKSYLESFNLFSNDIQT